jgi:hypothetical protein
MIDDLELGKVRTRFAKGMNRTNFEMRAKRDEKQNRQQERTAECFHGQLLKQVTV